jgi:hypothetical protein
MQRSLSLRTALQRLQLRLHPFQTTLAPTRQVQAHARRRGGKLADERMELQTPTGNTPDACVGSTRPSSVPSPAVTKLEWTRPLSILKYPDPRLRAKNALVGVFDDTIVELAKEMFDLMYEYVRVYISHSQVLRL